MTIFLAVGITAALPIAFIYAMRRWHKELAAWNRILPEYP